MKLSDDFRDQKPVNMTLINMTLLMSVIVIAILGLVFWINMPAKAAKKDSAEKKAQTSDASKEMKEAEDMKASVDELISGSSLTSNDLDIWNLEEYSDGLTKEPETSQQEQTVEGDGVVSSKSDYQNGLLDDLSASKPEQQNSTVDKNAVENVDETSDIQQISIGNKEEQSNAAETDEKNADEEAIENDGNHTKVQYLNGDEEWIEINPKLTKNDYDFTRLMYQKPAMNYYVDGKKASYFGMDLSKSQGVVDFQKFKKAGGNFAMLKLGSRGYSSGQIVIDEKFSEYAKNATDAGIPIGAYFFSQAATVKEAEEEAKLVIDNLKGFEIKYPVAYRAESIGGDMTRVDDLSVEERTEVARTFLDKIKTAGYIPMLYGNKEWLLTKYNLEDLQDYEIWYAQEADKPDYPYKMGMWEYTTKGSIDGVAGDIKLDISFKNYASM